MRALYHEERKEKHNLISLTCHYPSRIQQPRLVGIGPHMRRRRLSAARMNDVTGTRKRVRHQGTQTGEQLTISLADATRCEAWEFMNKASGLSLSNDTSAVTLFTK